MPDESMTKECLWSMPFDERIELLPVMSLCSLRYSGDCIVQYEYYSNHVQWQVRDQKNVYVFIMHPSGL